MELSAGQKKESKLVADLHVEYYTLLYTIEISTTAFNTFSTPRDCLWSCQNNEVLSFFLSSLCFYVVAWHCSVRTRPRSVVVAVLFEQVLQHAKSVLEQSVVLTVP